MLCVLRPPQRCEVARDNLKVMPSVRARLPDISYPVPLVIKNTFFDVEVEQLASERRLAHSAPASAIDAAHGAWQEAAPPLAKPPAAEGSGRSTSVGSSSSSRSSVELPEPSIVVKNTFLHTDLGRPLSLEGWLEERKVQSSPVSCVQQHEESVEAAAPLALSAATAAAQELLRCEAAQSPTWEVPTLGSAEHYLGNCRPCAYVHTAKGCRSGEQCTFCHFCPRGEVKRQQKARRRKADAE